MPRAAPDLSSIFLTPARMAAAFVPDFAYPPHVREFERLTLDLLFTDDLNRLVVECAVRHGKSFWWTFLVPAWILLTQPGKHIIIVAHNEDLAGDFVSRIRDFVRTVGPKVGRTLDPEQSSKHHLRVLGGTSSDIWGFGREGALRGRGAHYMVVDDLIRDSDSLTGETLPRINSWFMNATMRMEPHAKIAIVMSRAAPNDVSGFCLDQNAALAPQDQWHSVKFPAISADGAALWPERYPITWLRNKQHEFELAGEAWQFDAQFQQEPTANPALAEFPRSYFTDIYYTTLPPIVARYGGVDVAQGRSESGDYSVAVVVAVDAQGNNFVEDILIRRCPITAFEELAAEFFVRNPCTAILVEVNVESGFPVHMAEIAATRYNDTLYINEVYHTEPKECRIRKYLTPTLHAHTLKFRDNPQMRQAVAQLSQLFSGQYDDAPDALAIAIEMRKAHTGEPI